MVERMVYIHEVAGSSPAPPTIMRKIITISILLILLISLVLFIVLSKKEFAFKKSPAISTTISTTTESTYITELNQKIQEEINKLTKNIKPDENKSVTNYFNEISIFLKNFNSSANKEIDHNELLKNAEALSKINPPKILYDFHLELISSYYKIGYALKEFKSTDDKEKKLLLYNFINTIIKNLKF
jgi:hypothetical protein